MIAFIKKPVSSGSSRLLTLGLTKSDARRSEAHRRLRALIATLGQVDTVASSRKNSRIASADGPG